MIDITENIMLFRELLRDSLATTKELSGWNRCPEQFLHDFAQVAWELLLEKVENELLLEDEESCVLSPYGRGAALCGQSGRATHPEVEATHQIVCLPREGDSLSDRCTGEEFSLGEDDDFSFDCFGACRPNVGGFEFLEMTFPLDHLRCTVNGVVRVVKAEECNYYLWPLS